jgi:hypothetical protein
MDYTIDHIRAAFRAAKKGLSEAGFINYLEFHSQRQEDAPTVKRGRKLRVAKNAAVKPAKPRKIKWGKRGALGASILKFLSTKGKAGAGPSDRPQASLAATNLKLQFAGSAGDLGGSNSGILLSGSRFGCHP